MKRLLPFIAFIFVSQLAFSQCGDLFFSEYVEGYANNKALEIYNPTDEAKNLSDYSVVRFRNGATTAASDKIQQLPDVMLEPKDVFVVVVDLTDTTQWDSQFDKPAWNGYNVIDTLFDAVTGQAITDSLGNVILGPQYSENGSALFGDEYDERYDLQCKADAFICPEYDVNNTMYFNGNDAMALISGTELSPTGDNLLDVIGVIGEDPEVTIMEDAWVNEDGFWLTKNRTLVRKPEVAGGRTNLNDIVLSLGGTFTGEEWFSYRNNTFDYLGIHQSACNEVAVPSLYSCSLGPITSTVDINTTPIKVYPNPTDGTWLNVNAEEQISRIELYDLTGRIVRTQSNIKAQQFDLNLSNVDKGMYILNVIFSESKLSVTKVIVE